MSARYRVEHPPAKPLALFDGNCHFCRRWIERWRILTRGQVDYLESQAVRARFPEIPAAEFERALQLVEPDGRVFSGAEAVLLTLAHGDRARLLLAAYQGLPGFAPVAEFLYGVVAHHRGAASAATRLLWGNDVRSPAYFAARRWFLRLLAIVYLIAFVSLWVQVDGLIGANGILPAAKFFPAASAQMGPAAFWRFPSLCWLNASNTSLHLLCAAGVACSLLLLCGLLPVISLALLFIFYLSLVTAGQTFLSFQWDILLLETGFLAIFFAPWTWRVSLLREERESGVALFLLKALLFKLMFLSGLVKLTSGDNVWWNLTALDFHYWSQPLPTVFAWWSNLSPDWLKRLSVGTALAIELVAPFFIWAPRRLRLLAFFLLVGLQLAIALTGNYGFFNLLTITLCLLLLDDSYWRNRRITKAYTKAKGFHLPAIAILLLTLPLNLMIMYSGFRPRSSWPEMGWALYARVAPFRIANSYGLFRVMTKTRAEIVVEGSRDGVKWQTYEFRWKPGDLLRAPAWVAPHQPRLDWQMWFAGLGSYGENPWFLDFSAQLLKGSPEVNRLLARNPFASAPPRYLRATLYSYRFTTLAERRVTGAWWKREEHGRYLPEVSREDFSTE